MNDKLKELFEIKGDAFIYIKNCGLPVLLYGMGNGADRMREYFSEYGIELRGVFANDEYVRGQSYATFKVINYERAKKRFEKFCVVSAFGIKDEKSMQRMREIGTEQLLLFPDVPLFGGELANSSYFDKNRQRIEKIYDKIEDEESRRLFGMYLKYRRTGDLSMLDGVMTDEIGLFKKAEPKTGEVYIDGGAYDGDSIKSYISASGGNSAKKIYAIEPDKNSFRKLTSYINSSGYENIFPINAALADKSGYISFSEEASRNSHITEESESENKVRAISIDEELKDEKIGFIKLDLEGGEMNALKGMSECIKRDKPTLMLAAYHKTDDIFSLAEYALSLVSEYKLQYAKLNCYPGWDLFAILKI